MLEELRDHIYSNFSEIKEALDLRAKDQNLQKAIEEYLHDEFPDFLKGDKRKAVFVRAIHTPNYEHHFFRDIIKDFDLEPVFCNYSSGKLVMKNSEKYHLVKMGFFEKFNSKQEMVYSYKNVININQNEGKNMKDIMVKDDLSLVDFHSDLIYKSGFESDFIDISDWFNKNRDSEDGNYAKFLALFLRNAVLFDNYLLADDSEKKFFMDKVLPSFNFLKEKFGYKPLIFPALPIKQENDSLFLFYNQGIKNIIKEKYDI